MVKLRNLINIFQQRCLIAFILEGLIAYKAGINGPVPVFPLFNQGGSDVLYHKISIEDKEDLVVS